MSPDARLCLALDGCTPRQALAWIARTRDRIGVFKVGLELFCAGGPALVDACRDAGAEAIFLDLKLHDIPRTVARAIAGAARPGVRWITVHGGGGRAMLEEAQVAAEAAGVGLLAVTVLTSLDAEAADEAGLLAVPEVARRRARLAAEAGLTGIVCSVHEASDLRARHPTLLRVVPGIRWAEAAADDQRRVADPAQAIKAGADVLVVGRMVTQAADADEALQRIQEAIP
ncbi:MAG: orotidine-5'-phosphate decarboxylase [Myxococcales bacterium]|nr:orotidine-5'-phosphate decarboxylase [Myxococcales bacterium]